MRKRTLGTEGSQGLNQRDLTNLNWDVITVKTWDILGESAQKDWNANENKLDSRDASIMFDGYESAEVLIHASEESKKDWILNSGCSFRMSANKDWFVSFEEIHGGIVLLRNNKACKITGKCTIKIRMFDGYDRYLKNVRYDPDLRRNLIYLGVLDSLGYVTNIESGNMRISKGAMVVMKGKL